MNILNLNPDTDIGASAWLVWVVSQEAGSTGVLATAAGLVLLGFAAWVLGITQGVTGHGRRIGQSAAVAATASSACRRGRLISQARPRVLRA